MECSWTLLNLMGEMDKATRISSYTIQHSETVLNTLKQSLIVQLRKLFWTFPLQHTHVLDYHVGTILESDEFHKISNYVRILHSNYSLEQIYTQLHSILPFNRKPDSIIDIKSPDINDLTPNPQSTTADHHDDYCQKLVTMNSSDSNENTNSDYLHEKQEPSPSSQTHDSNVTLKKISSLSDPQILESFLKSTIQNPPSSSSSLFSFLSSPPSSLMPNPSDLTVQSLEKHLYELQNDPLITAVTLLARTINMPFENVRFSIVKPPPPSNNHQDTQQCKEATNKNTTTNTSNKNNSKSELPQSSIFPNKTYRTMKGVSFDRSKRNWEASWLDARTGRRVKKCFSEGRWGSSARELAIMARKEAEKSGVVFVRNLHSFDQSSSSPSSTKNFKRSSFTCVSEKSKSSKSEYDKRISPVSSYSSKEMHMPISLPNTTNKSNELLFVKKLRC